eukprot:GFYU01016354.1.p1 GENE.GFYU01016354.1~~GFYU01016354.1.p1  ORF type:complete len:229 (-),score=25.61 GFYU01016354.1:14-700(-)
MKAPNADDTLELQQVPVSVSRPVAPTAEEARDEDNNVNDGGNCLLEFCVKPLTKVLMSKESDVDGENVRQPHAQLTDIPEDVWAMYIFPQLDLGSVYAVAAVSSELRTMCKRPQLWSTLLETHWTLHRATTRDVKDFAIIPQAILASILKNSSFEDLTVSPIPNTISLTDTWWHEQAVKRFGSMANFGQGGAGIYRGYCRTWRSKYMSCLQFQTTVSERRLLGLNVNV